jgi:hypothetical protein
VRTAHPTIHTQKHFTPEDTAFTFKLRLWRS